MVIRPTRSAAAQDPFAPPHAAQPAVLVGRDAQLEVAQHLLDRLSANRFAVGIGFTGCRGTGKSVLLGRVADECGRRNMLALRMVAGSAHFERGFSEVIRRAISDETGRREWRLLPRDRAVRAKAKGRLPFTQVDIELEADTARASSSVDRAFERVFDVITNYATAAVLLLDEADFLTSEQAEACLVQPLGRAAELDLPLTAVIAGTGRSLLRTMRGVSTFADGLMRSSRLHRLEEDEARELLIRTAAVGEQDWSDLDLETVVAACIGIPRMLQGAGSEIFCALASGVASDVAVTQVTHGVLLRRRSLEAAVLEPRQLGALRRIREVLLTEATPVAELASDLVRSRLADSIEAATAVISSLEHRGALDVNDVGEATAVLF